MKKFVCVVVLAALLGFLVGVSNAASKIYGFTALTGSSSLASISGTGLNDGDMAFGVAGGIPYRYYLDADSGLTQAVPFVVAPATNAGLKRWVRVLGDVGTSDIDAQEFSGGFTDSAISAALSYIGATNSTLLLRSGTWVVSNNITVPSTTTVKLLPGANLQIGSGKTVVLNGAVTNEGTISGAGALTIGTTGKLVNQGGTISCSGAITINGAFSSLSRQIFTGSGVVTFGAGSLSEIIPEFWAKGDGTTDDTTAFSYFVSSVNASTGIHKATLNGVYLVDYSALPSPFALMYITRGDLTIEGSGTIKAKSGSYGAGVVAGTAKIYYGILITGDRVAIRDIVLDGNNQFTQGYPNLSVPQWWFYGVRLAGPVGYNMGNIISKVAYINGGGQAFVGSKQVGGIIENCYAEHNMAIGFDGSDKCIVQNNYSYNAHDAHFGTWNSTNAIVSGNIGDTSDNGSGIDVSGSVDALITGNVLRNCSGAGVHVTIDPSTATVPRRISITNNRLYDNSQTITLNDNAGVRLGNEAAYTSGETVSDVLIEGNHIFSDTSPVFVGKGVSKVQILNNVLEPVTDGGVWPTRINYWFSDTDITTRGNTTQRAGAGWYDSFLGTAGIIYADDPVNHGYIYAPNLYVLTGLMVGSDGSYKDIQYVNTVNRPLAYVEFTDGVNLGFVKIKVIASPNSDINYAEKEWLLLGKASTTVTVDSTVNSFVSTSASGTITLTTNNGELGRLYIFGQTDDATYRDIPMYYELTGKNVKFYKVSNH